MVKDDDFTRYGQLPDISKKEKEDINNKDYQLIDNYSDPFFGWVRPTVTSTSHVGIRVQPKPEVKWPEIHFNGYILNKNIVRGHLTINGEDKILQLNETILDNCLVTAITPDSVQVRYQGNSRWFKK